MIRRTLLAVIALVTSTALALADDKKAGPIRVACVGDSITFGAGVTHRDANSYPVVLGKLLGSGYVVKNFGVSGATMLSKGDKPYTKQKAYTDALAFDPHVVVIKLGTNDTKPQNWKHEAEFAADCKAMAEAFGKGAAKPKVYLCVPVPVYPPGAFGINADRLTTGVKPKVEALGKELGLPVIDLYAALSDKPALFPDKVHPTADGAKLIAEAVAAALKK